MTILSVVGATVITGSVAIGLGCFIPDLKRFMQRNIPFTNSIYDSICPDSPEEKTRRKLQELKEQIVKSGKDARAIFDEAAVKESSGIGKSDN